MKHFKKFTAIFFAVLFFLGVVGSSATTTAYAADNHVTNIDIEVVIRDDGSAVVTQYWTGDFSEGTENYIPIRTGDISISEFSVWDENGPYTLVSDWDIDASFKEKAGKCGIVSTDDGVELCFGITEYGHKEYTFSYVVTDFIKSYRDADGTNFMFVNPKMSTFPTAGTIEIKMENGTRLAADNAGIWAFGFEGQIMFQDGSVVAYTEKNLEGKNSMIVMLELDKELLSPRKSVGTTFAQVKEEAMKDSSYGHYENTEDAEKAVGSFFGIFIGSIFAVIFGVIFYSVKRGREIKEFNNSVGYFADVPNGGNIEMTYYLARTFDVSSEDTLIIGALMLSMMNKNCIELRETAKGTLELCLLEEPDTEAERRIFYMFAAEANEDGILSENEMEEYAYEYYEKIQRFINSLKENGKTAFERKGGFLKNPGSRIKHLSETGKSELAQVIGFKKYLEENSRMAERNLWEANLWQEYLVYATLFGVAEDVIEKLKRLYPEQLLAFENYGYRYWWCHHYYDRMHHSMDKAAAAEDGSGGSSSVGGGGGFSGGGVGGGSR